MIRVNSSHDTRPSKKHKLDLPEIGFSCLPSDVVSTIFSHFKMNSSIALVNSQFYHISGNMPFWAYFAKKVGAIYKISPTECSVQLMLPSKFELSDNAILDPTFCYRRNTLTALSLNSKFNQLKFNLFKDKFFNRDIGNILENFQIKSFEYLKDNPSHIKNCSYISKKVTKLTFNNEFHDEISTQIEKVDLHVYLSHNFEQIAFNNSTKDYKRLQEAYFSFMRSKTQTAINHFLAVNRTFSTENEHIAVTRNLFLAKALFYLQNSTEEQVEQAKQLFTSVMKDEKASKYEQSHANFYSLMMRCKAASSEDTELEQDLIFLNEDKKLPTEHHDWIDVKLARLCMNKGTAEGYEMAMSYFDKFLSRITNWEYESTGIYLLAKMFGALSAIRCNSQREILKLDYHNINFTEEKYISICKFCCAIQTIRNQTCSISYIQAKDILQTLIRDCKLNEPDCQIALEAINQCNALVQKLEDKEFIKENVKKMDGSFIQFMAPKFYLDEEFLIELSLLKSDCLQPIMAKSSNNDPFLKIVVDKLKEAVIGEFDFYKLENYSNLLINICRNSSVRLKNDNEFISKIQFVLCRMIHEKSLPRKQIKNLAIDVRNLLSFPFPELAFAFHNKPFLEKILEVSIPNPCNIIPSVYLADHEYLRKLISLGSYTTKKELSKYLRKYENRNSSERPKI